MRASDKTLAAESIMFAMEGEIRYCCLAIMVNLKFIKQLVDELPDYATSDWNGKATAFISKLQSAVTRLEVYCQKVSIELDEDTECTVRCFIFDVRAPLPALYGYCNLIEISVPSNDPVHTMLQAISTYTADIQNLIDCLRSNYLLSTE
jgi:hypothetical protein